MKVFIAGFKKSKITGPGMPHFTKDGKLYKGPTHMSNGKLMTGKTHTSKSEFLFHSK